MRKGKTNNILILTACFLGCVVFLASVIPAKAQTIDWSATGDKSDFPVIVKGKPAAVFVEEGDHEVVKIAARMLHDDLGKMSGRETSWKVGGRMPSKPIILIGSLQKSSAIKQLIAEGKLAVDSLEGKWEASLITVVENPFPRVPSALVITGSDRRGTAYGCMELLKQLGVSPWAWWADVPVPKRGTVFLPPQTHYFPPPAVQYRGIFLNDELWGLQQWAMQLQGDGYRGIGPKAYQKIFELMLRLKANYLWPARHNAFNDFPENAALADRYAVVRGGAHNSPMLGNARKEWDAETQGPWNYQTNAENIKAFWRENLRKYGGYENLYTMGMRGTGDLGMEGGRNIKEKVDLLENIIRDQRQLLAEHLPDSIQPVPQALMLYKEVLKLYEQGLHVPDDITLVWPEDNYGYLKRLPNPSEKERPGGSGIYYHLSYLGRPHDYLWLCTVPPALIYSELKKAWEFGAQKIWVVNVGDIKPAEYALGLSMDLAWNADSMRQEDVAAHMKDWYCRIFGEDIGKEAVAIKKRYYHLAFPRRPEHTGWSRIEPRSPITDTEWSFLHYREAERRLQQYAELQQEVEALFARVPQKERPSFFQLVYYPVMGAALMEHKLLLAQKQRWHAHQGRVMAAALADSVQQAHQQILSLTETYEQLLDDKWKDMGSYDDMPFPVYKMPPLDTAFTPKNGEWGLWIEGNGKTGSGVLPNYHAFAREPHFFELFNKGDAPLEWMLTPSAPWIRVDKEKGILDKQERITVDIDWEEVPKGKPEMQGQINVSVGGVSETILVNLFVPPLTQSLTGIYLEIGGVASIPAEKFQKATDKAGLDWDTVEGMGLTGQLVSAFPITAEAVDHDWDIAENAPSLEYDFFSFSRGWFDVHSFVLPTHPIHNFRGAKFAVSIDDNPPLVVDFATHDRSEEWKQNVARNATRKITRHYLEQPGKHTLKIWLLDTGVYFDRFLLDFGGLQESYLGPESTFKE